MIRRLFAPRKRPAATRHSTFRPRLEQLEKREVLNAALIQGFNYLTFNAYQTAQQIQQVQATAQSDLAHFQRDAASYTAGKGATLGQLNQDLAAIKQDANSIQGLNGQFQNDLHYFILGLLFNSGNISSSDSGSLLIDAYFLRNGLSQVTAAMQTSNDISGVTLPTLSSSTSSTSSTSVTPPSSLFPAIKPTSTSSSNSQLVTLTLNPLNVKLLGLNVQTDKIQVNISAQQGQSDLLGNLLGDTSNLLNMPAVSSVLNNVLGNVVTLLNSGSLSVANVNTSTGSLTSPPSGSTTTTTTPVLTLHVAPVKLDLMGAVVTTSPIDLTITAQSGQGLVLGNVVTDLANLFNPPLPNKLSINDINAKLNHLLNELNQQIPNISSSTPPVTLSNGQFLNLTVAPINLNLLGLVLKTSSIQVNASNATGNGDLLGNITTTLLNTVGATPQNLTTLNNDLNAILGKVIGVLNASSLTLPTNALSTLSPALQQLASPTLINSSGTASAPILNLAIASNNSSTPPVNVDLLGLDITTSNIQAQLLAQTGTGQILGNLLYNVANLLNPGGLSALLPILTDLGL